MYRPPTSVLAPYLYEAWYNDIDYAYAYEWFRSHTPVTAGGCSTVRKGNLIGRNLDWIYSESAEFIVHTDGVVGVANAIPGLTDAFVRSGADSELYKIVPFMLSDGMNKHGLVVSTLVVPTDKGDNSVVRPLGTSAHMMCTLMLSRYMLDHFRTALGAMTYFKDNITLYHPKTLQDQHYDQHFIIADAVHTLCMEFVDGHYNVTNINHKPFVTNFHLIGVEFNADGSVNTPATGGGSLNKITSNGSGLERYNLINAHTGDIQVLMQELAYTRAYQSHSNPAVPRWDTEFVGNGRTVDTPSADYNYVQLLAAVEYDLRSRASGTTWQTVHSAIYDIENKTLRIAAQENFDTQWEVSVMSEQTHVQHLRGDTAKNDVFTGAAGEFTVNTTSHSIRVHDGMTQGGFGTVNATVIDGAYEGMDAPKDLPVGAHVISGDGPLDGDIRDYELCEFYDFRHPTLRPGFVPRYGTLINNAATLYPKAWAYLQTAEGQLLCKTESEWQALSTAPYVVGGTEGWNGIGGVPFYVQDLGAGTLRVPDTRGMYSEDAGFDSLNVGSVKGPGLPNITGGVGWICVGTYVEAQKHGALSTNTPTLHTIKGTGGGNLYTVILSMNASEDNPIYGSSTVVSPRRFGILPCVYLGA